MTLRACLYHRVSTLEQDATLARKELRAFADRMNFTVTHDIEETGSGARNDRPGLQRALTVCRRNETDVLLVVKVDRLGRSALDVLSNVRLLTAAGCRFMATSQGLDIKPMSDPMSQLQLTMLAGIAEFERDLIKERTARGIEKARENGVRFGRREITVDVERARELRAAGQSWAEVAKALRCTVWVARRAVGQ